MSFFSFSVLPPWSNFIFRATISIYQLINTINTAVFRIWNNQNRAVLRTSQKSFLSNDITYFFIVTRFFYSKQLIWKVFFFSKLLSQASIEQARVRKITVRAYVPTVREKMVVVQKYFITSALSYAWDSNTVYVIPFIWHLIIIMFWSKQAKK